MFDDKLSIAKMCKIHLRTFQVVYNNYDKSNDDLLNFSNHVSVFQRHLRLLGIEIHKSLMNINSYGNFLIKIQFSTIYEKEMSHLPDTPVMEVIP